MGHGPRQPVAPPGQYITNHTFINPIPYVLVASDNKRLLAWVPGNERYTTITAFNLANGKELFSFNDQGRDINPSLSAPTASGRPRRPRRQRAACLTLKKKGP